MVVGIQWDKRCANSLQMVNMAGIGKGAKVYRVYFIDPPFDFLLQVSFLFSWVGEKLSFDNLFL